MQSMNCSRFSIPTLGEIPHEELRWKTASAKKWVDRLCWTELLDTSFPSLVPNFRPEGPG